MLVGQFVAARNRTFGEKIWWLYLLCWNRRVDNSTANCLYVSTQWLLGPHSHVYTAVIWVSPKWILQDKMFQILKVQVQSIIEISLIIYPRHVGIRRETVSELKLGFTLAESSKSKFAITLVQHSHSIGKSGKVNFMCTENSRCSSTLHLGTVVHLTSDNFGRAPNTAFWFL